MKHRMTFICLIASAFAAYFATRVQTGAVFGASVVIALFIAMVVAMLIPLSMSVALCPGERLALVPMCGDVVMLLVLIGCTSLVAREVALEIRSMFEQYMQAIEAGMRPALFRTRSLSVDGFTLVAPHLFLAIPVVLGAVCIRSGMPDRRAPIGSDPRSRIIGGALVLLSMVMLSWMLAN